MCQPIEYEQQATPILLEYLEHERRIFRHSVQLWVTTNRC